jgi:hypothetical protein
MAGAHNTRIIREKIPALYDEEKLTVLALPGLHVPLHEECPRTAP